MAKCDVDNRHITDDEQCWYCDRKFLLGEVIVQEPRTNHKIHWECGDDDYFQFLAITPVTKESLDSFVVGYAGYESSAEFLANSGYLLQDLIDWNVYIEGREREGYFEHPDQCIPLPAPCIKTTVTLLVIVGGRCYIENDVVAFVHPETRFKYAHRSKFQIGG